MPNRNLESEVKTVKAQILSLSGALDYRSKMEIVKVLQEQAERFESIALVEGTVAELHAALTNLVDAGFGSLTARVCDNEGEHDTVDMVMLDLKNGYANLR